MQIKIYPKLLNAPPIAVPLKSFAISKTVLIRFSKIISQAF